MAKSGSLLARSSHIHERHTIELLRDFMHICMFCFVFRVCCISCRATQVTTEQDSLLKNAFSLIDFDGDGKLGEDEFRALLR